MITGNNKLVSVYTAISKAYRDMGLVEQLDLSDAIEWAGEAIEFIGTPYAWHDKRDIIRITNGKAKLPCDLHLVNTIRCYVTDTDYEDCFDDVTFHWHQMRYGNDLFHNVNKHGYCKDVPDCYTCAYTYIMNDDYVFTNFETGYIELSYKAIPIDENGYPLIPDDVKYMNAVTYHIMMKLAFIKWMSGTIQENIYRKIEQDRDWYIGAAQNRGKMPSIDLMEGIKNNIIRLIPKINQHVDAFRTSGDLEQRHNLSNKYNRIR